MSTRDFVPPALVAAVSRWWPSKRPPGCYGAYASYDFARAACGVSAYEDREIIAEVGRKARHLLGQPSPRDLPSQLNAPFAETLMACALADTHGGRTINVLDFGGGCGTHYLHCREFFGRRMSFRWNVVETPAMVAEGRRVFPAGEVEFFESVAEAAGRMDAIDVFMASGVFQYTPSPLEHLHNALSCGARSVVF